MKVQLLDTASKEKKVVESSEVKFYGCGPTVYRPLHIGNWRTFILYDTLVRTLKYHGYKVNEVINITDVGHLTSDADEGEDKVEKQARDEGSSAKDITSKYTQQFLQDMDKLNFIKPTTVPVATEHIQEQIDMVKTLEDKGFTYKIDDGIYFDTSKFKDYGKMAKLDLDGQGNRIESNPQKKQPQDFALWKFSPKDSKRQMEWDSPWGVGFPGWHLECSAMALK